MSNTYIEAPAPLYTVKAYEHGLYRVCKRLCAAPRPRLASDAEEEQEKEETTEKFSSALIRAKNTVREYALCNRWDYFLTITFDIDHWNRYALQERIKELMQYFQNLRKRGVFPKLRYILVPEFHKDGAVHFHGLISGIPEDAIEDLPPWAPVSARRDGNRHLPLLTSRYGWCTLSPIVSNIGVGFYISKYITKSMASMAVLKGVHTYDDNAADSPALFASLPVVDNTFTSIMDWFGDTFFIERTKEVVKTGYTSERYSYSGSTQLIQLPYEETVTETVQVLNPQAVSAAVIVVLTFVTVVTWLKGAIFGRLS